jgi:hypothetical protein
MAITRTYAVGDGGRVIRLDNHVGPWVDVTPNFPLIEETTLFDVMCDPLNPDKVTVVGESILPNNIGCGILVSNDAGVTWVNPGGNWGIQSSGSYSDFKEVWYADSNVIWAVGTDRAFGIVVVSTDGGLTFNRVNSPVGFNQLDIYAVHALSATTAIIAGTTDIPRNTSNSYAFKTTDSGVTWVTLNGGSILPGPPNEGVGIPNGAWISADETRIVIGAYSTQVLSTDGGATFNSTNVPFVESGYHLTWFPSHSPNPPTMRHTGGVTNTVNDSINNGTSWVTTRSSGSFVMGGAHFWDTDDGYYIDDNTGNVFSTNDGAVTGTISHTVVDSFKLISVWTQLALVDPPTQCPCYLVTDCTDPSNQLTIQIDCITQNPLNPATVYKFSSPDYMANICWTVEEIACPVPNTVDIMAVPLSEWLDCDDCVTPNTQVPNTCWDLEVTCEGTCNDIFAINGFDFTPYIGQNITIQPALTDPECWYTPYALRQAVFQAAPQTYEAGYALTWPLGAFQLGADDITISIPSLVHNGVEQIVLSPPTNLLTPANIQFVNCQQMACANVPITNPAGITGYANTVDFINVTLANLGILTIQAYNNSFDNCPITEGEGLRRETFRLQYRDGDTFAFTIQYSNISEGVQTVLYEVQAGNITVSLKNGNIDAPLTTCNENIYCLTNNSDSPVINAVTIMGDCPVEPIDLGEACEVTPRLGEPGFSVKNCDPKTVINVKTKFADSVYAQFKRTRYGIDTCCEYDLDKIDIKNQLIDLGAIYDPEMCVDGTPIDEDCCLQPCNAVATLIIPQAVSCPAPINASTTIVAPVTPPINCLAPSDPVTTLVYITPDCFCTIPSIASAELQPGNYSGNLCDGTPFDIPIVYGVSYEPLCVLNDGQAVATSTVTLSVGDLCDQDTICEVPVGCVCATPSAPFVDGEAPTVTMSGFDCDGTPFSVTVTRSSFVNPNEKRCVRDDGTLSIDFDGVIALGGSCGPEEFCCSSVTFTNTSEENAFVEITTCAGLSSGIFMGPGQVNGPICAQSWNAPGSVMVAIAGPC